MLNHKFWKKYFKDYDILNIVIPYQELLKTICEELDIKKGEKILEAGSGTGNFTNVVLENFLNLTNKKPLIYNKGSKKFNKQALKLYRWRF